MSKVSCIVVTFNKVELLKENIDALLAQTNRIEEIMIIDNASTDGTEEFAQGMVVKESNISYHKLKENIGGAGGFNYGMKEAYRSKCDYIWVMDDDSIPSPTALEELLRVANRTELEWGFLSSDVRWIDGTPCVMNIPAVAREWNSKIDDNLVQILSGTFVSLLFPREILKEVGLPIKEFFIWSDDIEFTRRISTLYPSYFVSASKVLHKMGANNNTNIFEENDGNRVGRYFFSIRNKLYMEKKKSKLSFLRYILSLVVSLFKVLITDTKHKWKKIKVIFKGLFAGMVFNPKIEWVNDTEKREEIN